MIRAGLGEGSAPSVSRITTLPKIQAINLSMELPRNSSSEIPHAPMSNMRFGRNFFENAAIPGEVSLCLPDFTSIAVIERPVEHIGIKFTQYFAQKYSTS